VISRSVRRRYESSHGCCQEDHQYGTAFRGHRGQTTQRRLVSNAARKLYVSLAEGARAMASFTVEPVQQGLDEDHVTHLQSADGKDPRGARFALDRNQEIPHRPDKSRSALARQTSLYTVDRPVAPPAGATAGGTPLSRARAAGPGRSKVLRSAAHG
jgi:hypothetical protein